MDDETACAIADEAALAMFDVRDLPFEPDESRTMTLKESVIEARRLRARGLALGKEGDEYKSEAKDYHVSIMKGLEDIGTDSMKFDGKAVGIKEMVDTMVY